MLTEVGDSDNNNNNLNNTSTIHNNTSTNNNISSIINNNNNATTTTNTASAAVVAAMMAANEDLNGMVEERVKVDRKRFEQMLNDNTDYGSDADSFFRKVMQSTNTQIMWPPKLKPGTKSKKDPHVRITGSPHSINAAKEIIYEQLDTRRNRVTLKMDVAFTDHSHIIGKGGRSIQRVMDETGCHIHFPDSNRTNIAEKSNQVSIAGTASGVEQSRCRIRDMLPITLQFDLPLNNGLHSPPTLDPQSPQLQAIQQNYGITIAFRYDDSKCNNNSYFASSGIITVAVRGTRSHITGLRQGLAVLIEYLTGFSANSINVPLMMTVDVAVQHHSFIMGRSNNNIRAIMQSTGAVITMPDPVANSTTTTTTTGLPSSMNHNNNNTISNNNNNINSIAITSALCAALSATDLNNNNSSSSSAVGIPTPVQQQHQQHHSSQFGSTPTQSAYGHSNQTTTTTTTSSSLNSPTNNSPGNQYQSNNINTSNISSNNNNNNRKTSITIRGPNFESVYCAWQELLGHLPLILIFDLKEGQEVDAVQVTQLMDHMRQITILIKPKQRQNTKSIVVRGPERDSRLLFEVRKQILDLDDNEVPSCCDQHAFKLCSKLSSMLLPQCSNNNTSQSGAGSLTPSQSPNPKVFQALIAQQLKQLAPDSVLPMLKSLEKRLIVPQDHNHNTHHQQLQPPLPPLGPPAPPPHQQHYHQQSNQHQQPIHNLHHYHAAAAATTTTSHHHQQPNSQLSPIAQHQQSQQVSASAIVRSIQEQQQQQRLVAAPPGLGGLRSLSETGLDNQHMDYDEFRLKAVKAMMSKPCADKPRMPTPLWAGQGFSRSMSESTINHNIWDQGSSSSINSSSRASASGTSGSNGSVSASGRGSLLYRGPLFTQSNILDEVTRRDSQPDTSWLNARLLASSTGNNGINASGNNNNINNNNNNNNNQSLTSNQTSASSTTTTTATSSTSSGRANDELSSYLNLTEFLSRIGLVQYFGLFSQHDIDLGTLFNLTENDLADLGLPFLHRRKLIIAISEIKNLIGLNRLDQSTFEAAPGAERNRRNKSDSIVDQIDWM